MDMRDKKRTRIEVNPQAEREWTDTLNNMYKEGFWTRGKTWYNGGNIPGKTMECLTFMWGLPFYAELKERRLGKDYAGFEFRSCNLEK